LLHALEELSSMGCNVLLQRALCRGSSQGSAPRQRYSSRLAPLSLFLSFSPILCLGPLLFRGDFCAADICVVWKTIF